MDLPITLRFFERLNLYQDIKRLDAYGETEWSKEKAILSWAADPIRHIDRGTELTASAVIDPANSAIMGGFPSHTQDRKQYTLNRFGNLESWGYATWSSPAKTGIYFTRNGFLIGEIINELARRPSAERLYRLNIRLTWWIFYCGAFLVITGAARVVIAEAVKLVNQICAGFAGSSSHLHL